LFAIKKEIFVMLFVLSNGSDNLFFFDELQLIIKKEIIIIAMMELFIFFSISLSPELNFVLKFSRKGSKLFFYKIILACLI
jgi:hypothetical protein